MSRGATRIAPLVVQRTPSNLLRIRPKLTSCEVLYPSFASQQLSKQRNEGSGPSPLERAGSPLDIAPLWPVIFPILHELLEQPR
jgi:hypothetical protein